MSKLKPGDIVAVYGAVENMNGQFINMKRDIGIIDSIAESNSRFLYKSYNTHCEYIVHEKQCRLLKKKINKIWLNKSDLVGMPYGSVLFSFIKPILISSNIENYT